MQNKYTASDYFFQFVIITVGVLIALLINGLVEWNRDRELVAEARTTIAQEIAANKKDLESSLSGLAIEKTRLEAAIRFASEMLATKETTVNELQLHLNLADLSSTGWLTAARTGALGHMPYDEVQKYSRLYDLQDLFTDQQRRMLERLGTDGSPLAELEQLRRGAASAISLALPEPQAGLAAAMSIGLRDLVPRDVSNAFRISGLSHVVAISGWYIVMLGAVIGGLLQGIGR